MSVAFEYILSAILNLTWHYQRNVFDLQDKHQKSDHVNDAIFYLPLSSSFSGANFNFILYINRSIKEERCTSSHGSI